MRPSLPSTSTTHLSVLSVTTPVAMGYITLGTVFGFLFVQAGGSGWLAVSSSLLVYAGAAQYMMIPMLAAGKSLGTIALATFIVNLRHIFYGLSLLDKLPTSLWLKSCCVFGLTDETYSVLTTLPQGTPPQKMALMHERQQQEVLAVHPYMLWFKDPSGRLMSANSTLVDDWRHVTDDADLGEVDLQTLPLPFNERSVMPQKGASC